MLYTPPSEWKGTRAREPGSNGGGKSTGGGRRESGSRDNRGGGSRDTKGDGSRDTKVDGSREKHGINFARLRNFSQEKNHTEAAGPIKEGGGEGLDLGAEPPCINLC